MPPQDHESNQEESDDEQNSIVSQETMDTD